MRWSARAGAAASGPAAVRRALSGWACVGRGQGGAVGVGRVCVCVGGGGGRPGHSLSLAAAAAAAPPAAAAGAAMVVLVVAAAAGTLPTTSSEPLGRAAGQRACLRVEACGYAATVDSILQVRCHGGDFGRMENVHVLGCA